MRACVEHHLGLAHKAPLHKHPVAVHTTERWNGADLAVGVQSGDLVLACQPQGRGAGEHPKLLEIHHVMCRQHRLRRLAVNDAKDDFGPASPRDVRDSCLFLSGPWSVQEPRTKDQRLSGGERYAGLALPRLGRGCSHSPRCSAGTKATICLHPIPRFSVVSSSKDPNCRASWQLVLSRSVC